MSSDCSCHACGSPITIGEKVTVYHEGCDLMDNTPSDPTTLHAALEAVGRKMGTNAEAITPPAQPAGASETASPETPLDRVVNYIKGAMRPQSIAAATCEGPWDRGRRSGLQEALNSINAEFAKQPAPPAPAPQTPAQPAEETPLMALRNEGLLGVVRHWRERAEQAEIDLQRLSTAHETLQAEHDQLLAAFDEIVDIDIARQQLIDERQQAERRAAAAEEALAKLRSSRETEQRKIGEAAIRFAARWMDTHPFDAVERVVEAYQQRQPQEDGPS